MDYVADFTVEDIFLVSGRGIIATVKLRNDAKHGFKAGDSVKIIRPDETTIISFIRGIDNFQTVSGTKMLGLLLAELTKEDVPRGSKISIAE